MLENVQGGSCEEVEADGKSGLYYTSDGELSIRSLQLAGKKRMGIGDFLYGSRIDENYTVK